MMDATHENHDVELAPSIGGDSTWNLRVQPMEMEADQNQQTGEQVWVCLL